MNINDLHAFYNVICSGDASSSLRPEDAYHMGNTAFDLGDFDKALDWLQQVVSAGRFNDLHVSVSDSLCTMARIQFRVIAFSADIIGLTRLGLHHTLKRSVVIFTRK